VVTTFGLSAAEARQLTVNAIESGFAPYEVRRAILSRG